MCHANGLIAWPSPNHRTIACGEDHGLKGGGKTTANSDHPRMTACTKHHCKEDQPNGSACPRHHHGDGGAHSGGEDQPNESACPTHHDGGPNESACPTDHDGGAHGGGEDQPNEYGGTMDHPTPSDGTKDHPTPSDGTKGHPMLSEKGPNDHDEDDRRQQMHLPNGGGLNHEEILIGLLRCECGLKMDQQK